MRIILAILVVSALAIVAAGAQGLIILNNTIPSTRINTNSVPGGVATGLTAPSGVAYYYAFFCSTTATTVNGQTAVIVGSENNNYVFNDNAWTFVAYGTNRPIAGRLTAIGTDGLGQTSVSNVSGGTMARFVVIGWSANIGTNIAAVQTWFNGGFPFTDGWIGQSTVSGPLTLGDNAAVATTTLFGGVQPQLQGFLLGRVGGGLLASPFITTQPTNQTISPGGTATFSARAYGDASLSFSYQWRLNGNPISTGGNYSMTTVDFNNLGAHMGDFTLTVTNAQLTNAGNYSIIISNSAGFMISSNALLTILGASLPPLITSQPANATVAAGSNALFAVSANGTDPLSYQWSFNGTNVANATNASLILAAVQPTNAGSYSVSITNAFGATNSIAAVLTVQTFPPFITAHPASASILSGNSVTFTVGANGTAQLSYQWKFNGTNLPAATNASLPLMNVQANNGGIYSVLISNLYGTTNSFDATLTILPPTGYVLFLNSANSNTKIFTNSTIGGPVTGLTGTNAAKYYYALFASANATSVNGQTAALTGSAVNKYAFNDDAWTLVAYGTNTLRSGRLFSVGANASGETPVSGFAGGSQARFVVIGWSANIGTNIASVLSWFNAGFVVSDGWIGQSDVSGLMNVGDNAVIPSPVIFGGTAGQVRGFTLGLASPDPLAAYSPPNIPAPVLTTILMGNSMKLTWPAAYSSHGVQSASNFVSPWEDVGGTPVIEGTNLALMVPINSQQPIFRLIVK